MKKPKTNTYYAVICPICGDKSVGNWLELQRQKYNEHYIQNHYPDPIIKTQDESKSN